MSLIKRGTKNFLLMEQETPNQRLRLIRMLLHFNQTEFSKALGFKQSHISAIESEKKEVSVNIIYALINKFKVSANWLLSGNGEMFLTHHDHVEYSAALPNHLNQESIALDAPLKPKMVLEEQHYYLTEIELNSKIQELENAIIQEGYLPLFKLCDLYAVLLNMPLDYSVLQRHPVPRTIHSIPFIPLPPILLNSYDSDDFNSKSNYYLELDKIFKAWRSEFHTQFQKLYSYIAHPEANEEELNTFKATTEKRESESQAEPEV